MPLVSNPDECRGHLAAHVLLAADCVTRLSSTSVTIIFVLLNERLLLTATLLTNLRPCTHNKGAFLVIKLLAASVQDKKCTVNHAYFQFMIYLTDLCLGVVDAFTARVFQVKII